MSPEEMMSRALADDYVGGFTQELLSAFYKGFPIENLRTLLASENKETKSLAVYLVYELGDRLHPLISEITELLEHESPSYRFDAIIALTECTTKNDAAALGQIVLRFDDCDTFVHRGVMQFVQVAKGWQLRLGVQESARQKPEGVFADLPKILFSTTPSGRVPLAEKIKAFLGHSEPVARRFGVALALRPRFILDWNLLDLAELIDEEECQHMIQWARERKYPIPIGAEHGRIGRTHES